MYLDKAMPSKSVFSLLTSEVGHLSVFYLAQNMSTIAIGANVEMGWSQVERMGDEKLRGIINPERGRKKEARMKENLMR